MSAVADDVERTLEPHGLGHELLLEWAPWVRDSRDDRNRWSVKPRIGKGYDGDMPERVQIVDKIVARQKLRNHSDWAVVSRYYLGNYDIPFVARDLGWAENRVRVRLLAVCGLVEREYRDWFSVTC